MTANADTHIKATHLDGEEMWAVLRAVGFGGLLRAIAAWSEGQRPKNVARFRSPNGWVVRVANQTFPHRPLLALASELCGQRELNPNNFGLQNDTRCKQWLDEMGFLTPAPERP